MRDASADCRKAIRMPYYRCPACRVTMHSVGGRFTANTCPNCSASLASPDRINIGQPQAASCDLAAEPASAAAARRVLTGMLPDRGDAEFEIAELLTTELVANSVQHSGMGARDIVRLDVVVTDELIRIEVRDDGAGFVPAARMPDSPIDSHWGLHLIEQLATRWGVAAGPQTLVWVELERGVSAPMATPQAVAMSPVEPTFRETGRDATRSEC
jgi:anti-sigma regulatory factor (Ser/Thr protein kinase)